MSRSLRTARRRPPVPSHRTATAPGTAASRPPAPHHRQPGVRPTRVRLATLLLATCTPWAVHAADTAEAPPAARATVVITGNPLGADVLAQPSAVLAGEGLALRRAGTLGDTLDGLAGVAASGFGPQASRPVIRGLDGDRIRLLDNGGASADASNLSFDHAVAIDPLVIERVEVLRGPAALLYGGNATGGVVNTLDNRIPRNALDALGGRAELRLGGPAQDRASAALLEGGTGGGTRSGGLNWHIDAAQRRSDDLRTPRFTPLRDGQPEAAATRVVNSAGRSDSGALGASWADARGFAGLAVDGLRNDYGTTVEPDVSIHMRRQRLLLAGERRATGPQQPLAGLFSQVEWQASDTRYRHQEVEGDGAVGTTFRSRGQELRLQARQQPLATPLGLLTGVLGTQLERLDFSALGEEAFVPDTRSRGQALFVQQALALPGGTTLSAGARLEHQQVASDGDAADAAEPRFGAPSQRRFTPRSLSLGTVVPLPALGRGWQASATLGHTERAPAYYELYANGVHVATGAYERGDSALALERSQHLEAGLAWRQGHSGVKLQVWRTRFAHYIALDASGASVDVDGTAVPEYRFTGIPATLQGAELEGHHRLLDGPLQLDGTATLDLVHGRNRATDEPLARLAPHRATVGLQARQADWQWGGALRLLAAQRRVPANDTPTPGAALLDLWAGWSTTLAAGVPAQWLLKLGNVGNAVAFNASTIATARWLAPAGGRSLTGSLRISF